MVLANSLRLGRKYDFDNIEAWRKKDEEWISMGVGNWSGWFLERQAMVCHFKDDDTGCDLYVNPDTEYHFFLRPEPALTRRQLEDLMMLVCSLDEDSDEENDNNNNNNNNNNDGDGGWNGNNGDGGWNGNNGNGGWNGNQGGGKRRRPRSKTRKQKRKSRKFKTIHRRRV